MLSTTVTVPALLPRMPPVDDGEPFRYIGLTATWPTQYALRQAGFYATPAGRTGGAVSASLNGSLWPEAGSLRASDSMLLFAAAPWGQAPYGFSATYHGGSASMMDQPLEVSLLVSPEAATANSFITVNFDGGLIRVAADATGSVRVQMSTGTLSTVLSLSAAEMSGQQYVRLRVTAGGAWTLTNGEVTKSATLAVPATLQAVPTGITVSVPSTGKRIGGVNVGYYTTPPSAWTPSAVLDAPDGTLAASRAIVDRPVRAVLAERAEAERARMWIDSHGVFRWRSRASWGTGTPAREISDVDLLGYSMGMDYDSVYSGAQVASLDPTTEVRRIATITLHQGRRQVLNAGDVQEDLIEVPANEDWPTINTNMEILGTPGARVEGFNRGRRTWSGAVRVINNGTTDVWAYGADGDYSAITLDQINPRLLVHRIGVGTGLAADQMIETRTPRASSESAVWNQWAEFELPVIRGYARAMWAERQTRSAVVGTQQLPQLEHDCSWWVQGNAVQRLADSLAQRHLAPVLTITGLSIVPDERIEIGDVLTLTDKTFAGLSARVVVSGIDYQTSNGEASMRLDVEVVSVSATSKTYADVQAQADAHTYAQFQALIGALTYSEEEAS